MSFSGSLEKLTITAFKDDTFKSAVGDPFSVMINPASYSHSYEIKYNNRQAQGSSGGSPDFNKIGWETVKLDLVFDGTGVVSSPLPGIIPYTDDGIADQIDALKKLVFDYNGNTHSPNYIQLAWGKLLFSCRLSALTINYTMFKPDGTPLRARASATFIGFQDEKTLAKKANKSSPDLTHLVTIKAGDMLPLLCFDIYGSSDLYLEVARRNGLANFRALVPGSQLLFPPLQDAAP
jgi:hypothetical protein